LLKGNELVVVSFFKSYPALFRCGKVRSMKAIIDKQTNKCKGFGFIDFESHEDAQLAINELQKKGYTAQLAKVFQNKQR
jgi:RNA recognition motif-containing protein